MFTFHSFAELPAFAAAGTVLTVGNFDGVHRGHARILARAREEAAMRGLPVLVITFEPHPLLVLAPQRAPQRLTSAPEKLELLERAGVDAVLVLRSAPELFRLSADEFLNRLRGGCGMRVIVEGPDFHYGHGRAGNIATLRAAAAGGAFAVSIVEVEAHAPSGIVISSSRVRETLAAGNVRLAAELLGRPHRISGVVERGHGRGAQIGFPTANLAGIQQMIPADAVYAAVAQTVAGELFPAAVNIGPQPTFEQPGRRVEAHLLDVSRDFVGQNLGLHLITRLRGQQKFSGADALVAQLREDTQTARAGVEQTLGVLRTKPPIQL